VFPPATVCLLSSQHCRWLLQQLIHVRVCRFHHHGLTHAAMPIATPIHDTSGMQLLTLGLRAGCAASLTLISSRLVLWQPHMRSSVTPPAQVSGRTRWCASTKKCSVSLMLYEKVLHHRCITQGTCLRFLVYLHHQWRLRHRDRRMHYMCQQTLHLYLRRTLETCAATSTVHGQGCLS
jgi:hypothetical protein